MAHRWVAADGDVEGDEEVRGRPEDKQLQLALERQAEQHHRSEAEKKHESRKLPSQAEKRREKRSWFDKILAQRKTWEIHGGPTTKRGQIHFTQSNVKMQCIWPSRPCLGASDRTSSMCLQAAPRVKADEANHPKSYSPNPLASRTEPIQVSRFGSTVSRLHSSCAKNSGKGSVKSNKPVGLESR